MRTLYNQLTQAERYQIQTLHELQFSAREIAQKPNRSNKTISRQRFSCRGRYCAEMAHLLSHQKRHDAYRHIKLNTAQHHNLDWLSGLDSVSEQIAGRMKLEGFDGVVNRQTLYRWIAKFNWRSRLPRKRGGLQADASLIYKPHWIY